MANIYQAISEIMKETDAITKDRKNQQQGYSFRGIDDVYNAVHPLFAKHGVFSVPSVLEDRTEERATKNGGALIYRILKIKYTFCAADGTSIEAVVIGEGMDSGDKASNKAMAVAHKYAIMQILSIPTADEKDPENASPEVLPKSRAQVPPKNAPQGQNAASGATLPPKPDMDTVEARKLMPEFIFMSDPVFTDEERAQVKHSLTMSFEGPSVLQDVRAILKAWHTDYEARKAKQPVPGLVF